MEIKLRDIAGDVLPVRGFGENLSCTVHKHSMGIVVVLELEPHPSCWVTEITVNAQHAAKRDGCAGGGTFDVGVGRPDERPLDLEYFRGGGTAL